MTVTDGGVSARDSDRDRTVESCRSLAESEPQCLWHSVAGCQALSGRLFVALSGRLRRSVAASESHWPVRLPA